MGILLGGVASEELCYIGGNGVIGSEWMLISVTVRWCMWTVKRRCRSLRRRKGIPIRRSLLCSVSIQCVTEYCRTILTLNRKFRIARQAGPQSGGSGSQRLEGSRRFPARQSSGMISLKSSV